MRVLARSLALVVLAAACRGDGPVGPDRPGVPGPFSGVVSEPVAGSLGSGVAGAALLAPVAWVSAEPGTQPDAIAVTIENERSGASIAVEVGLGGFDPVAVAAAAGDLLAVEYRLAGGGTALVKAAVPERRRPRVVRTSPARGERDVALNAVVIIIFSEPISPLTLDVDAVALRSGPELVGGTVAPVTGSEVAIEFTPSEPLRAATTYELVLGDDIADLAGDALEPGAPNVFTTRSAGSSGDPFATITPSTDHLDFGAVGAPAELAIRFTSATPVGAGVFAASITAGSAPLFSIIASSCSDAWNPDDNSCEVRVRFSPSGGARPHWATLRLSAGDAFLPIPLSASTIWGGITFAPAAVARSVTIGTETAPIVVTVTNSGAADSDLLAIRLHDCQAWWFACIEEPTDAAAWTPVRIVDDRCTGIVLAPGANCTLSLAFMMQYYKETWALKVDATSDSLAIDLDGLGLRIEPVFSDFGAVRIGEAATRTLVVRNEGELPTGPMMVQPNHAAFTVVEDACTGVELAPGATCAVTVRFAPSTAGPHVTDVRFDGSPRGVSGVTVVGTGL